MTPRDVFLTELFYKAKLNNKIVLLSADMGAPALDVWRKDLPDQFFQTGIAEQNTINFGAGLSANGYKVYVYTMGCWAARCFEQLRYSCCMANNPITFLSAGVGLGYAPAGPAHEPTEDIAYLRSLLGIEIHTPTNNKMVKELVDLTIQSKKFRVIRLERNYDPTLDNFYQNEIGFSFVDDGVKELISGETTCVVSSGYMLNRALKVAEKLKSNYNLNIGVVDLWRIKPIDPNTFVRIFEKYKNILTLEEQTLSGGFGSAICEVSCDLNMKHKFLRLGLPEKYMFENGTREEIINSNGLSINNICDRFVSAYNE